MTAIANLPDLRPSLLLDFANSGRVDPRIQCTRASAATCYGPDGKLRTVAANVPRIDYDPVTGKCLGLLVEEPRTNLWLNSATAVTQSFAVTAQTYTLSFEGSGSIALTGAYSGDSSAGTVKSGRRVLTFTPSAGSLTCTPSGDVRNVQFEAGAFPTSYIPTEASAATRAADAPYLSGTIPGFDPDRGTLIVSYDYPSDRVSNMVPLSLDAGTQTNSIALASSVAGTDRFLVQAGGVGVFNSGFSPFTTGTRKTSGIAFGAGRISTSSEGRAAVTVTGVAMPVGLNRITLGHSGYFGQSRSNGHIARLAYYPVPVIDSQLQRLTT